jgi:hypothetical protein
MSEAVFIENQLDPKDPFDAALIRMRDLHRKKRADYAADDNRWSNFEDTSATLGFITPQDAIDINVAQKLARLKSLRLNGRAPVNESVTDTRQDLAVYAVLALVHAQEIIDMDEAF